MWANNSKKASVCVRERAQLSWVWRVKCTYTVLIAPTMKLCVNKGIRLQKMGNEIGIQTKNRLSKSMLPEKHPQFENYISQWPNFAPIGLSLFPNVKIWFFFSFKKEIWAQIHSNYSHTIFQTKIRLSKSMLPEKHSQSWQLYTFV